MIPAMVDEARPIGPGIGAAARPRVSPLAHVRYVIRSMRPKQWTKSGVVFLAFIFSVNQSWTPEDPSTWLPLLERAILTAIIFSLASGADYLVNDWRDRASDALHPRKSRRPIAAGLLS